MTPFTDKICIWGTVAPPPLIRKMIEDYDVNHLHTFIIIMMGGSSEVTRRQNLLMLQYHPLMGSARSTVETGPLGNNNDAHTHETVLGASSMCQLLIR